MAAASCQRCFLCLSFLSTPHFPAAAILESELGGGRRRRRNKGSSSSRHFDFPSVTAWRGRPLTSAYTTQSGSRPASASSRQSRRPPRGEAGRKREPPYPRLPEPPPPAECPANPLTHKPRPAPPDEGGGGCGTEPGGARPCRGHVPEEPRAPQGAPPPPRYAAGAAPRRPERAPRPTAHGARPQRRSGAPRAAPPPPAARCEAPETSRRRELRGRAAGPSPRGSAPF